MTTPCHGRGHGPKVAVVATHGTIGLIMYFLPKNYLRKQKHFIKYNIHRSLKMRNNSTIMMELNKISLLFPGQVYWLDITKTT